MSSKSSYVDLGLPSGTLWSIANAGGDNAFYTYDEAIQKFGGQLPTKEQLLELVELCKWTTVSRGCKVFGPNGNFIFLPANGAINCDGVHEMTMKDKEFFGAYMSSTICDSDEIYGLAFTPYALNDEYGGYYVEDFNRCISYSVRLVKN